MNPTLRPDGSVDPAFYGEDYFTRGQSTRKSSYEPYGGGEWAPWLADMIVDYVPDLGRVLDVGCATGVLVRELRKRGVDAWGFDASTWAVDHAVEGARPFLWCGDATAIDPYVWPSRPTDLIVCAETMEHLTPDQARAALRLMVAHSRRQLLLVGATDVEHEHPEEFDDPTHVNPWTMEEWRSAFAHVPTYVMSPQDGLPFDRDQRAKRMKWSGRFLFAAGHLDLAKLNREPRTEFIDTARMVEIMEGGGE
jgi:SAM-dependent methyltransferase